jgi:hypothetical protein
MFFGHGWKIGKRKHDRKMTVLLRRSCLQTIKVSSSVILTQGNHFRFGNKTWSSAGGEVMDGSLLVFVLMLKKIMRRSHWRCM